MTKATLYLLLLLPLFYSCGNEQQETEEDSTTTESYSSNYEFQNGENIHWETVLEGDYVVIKAFLNDDWNAYSLYNTNLLGPLPNLNSYDSNDSIELVGEVEEVGLKKKNYDESDSELGYFEDIAVFKQKIKSISGEEFVVTGNVNYMICNSTGCLPPADYSFELIVKP